MSPIVHKNWSEKTDEEISPLETYRALVIKEVPNEYTDSEFIEEPNILSP
jgi:hypothetical protein